MKQKPLIVITMGDPAGIGPEIIAKAVDTREIFPLCRPVVIGSADVMRKIIEEMGFSIGVRAISSIPQADPIAGRLDVLDLDLVNVAVHRWGKPDASCGAAVVAYIKKAVEVALRKEASAIVTAPISKAVMNAAGYHYAGHTELLAELTGCSEYGMLFVGGGLRVILATIHVALKDVPKQINSKTVLKTLRLAQNALPSLGIRKPRIGVCALNPHAGEGGLFGSEEADAILPAIIKARAEGIDVSDPLPADTLFYKARSNYYDVVVAMYHDQGLAPLKMAAFGNSVNVTVGLPIIRTSVDHGTAYDIAGKGRADPASLLEAIKVAVRMAEFQKGGTLEQ